MYFTVFTGIESIPPGMSDLGVIISIELSYPMWHEGRRGPEEVSSPDVCEGMPHCDAAQSLTWAYNSTKSMVTGCSPHCLILREWPELLINLLFPTICVNTCLRRVPACVEEVQKSCQERTHRSPVPTQQRKGQTKEKWCYIYKHSPTDAGRCGLDKGQHMLQGKRKMEYWWDKVEYEIACQVTNGSPSYETKDSSGKV